MMTAAQSIQRDQATIVRLPVENACLDLLLTVLNGLHREAISYCYWKSTNRIHSVLAGESDLDLLVARQDQHRARATLLKHGLKHFPSVAMRENPAIESFLGYDQPSGRLVHLHLHFRLVIGNRLHKNYTIPWENQILERAQLHPEFPIKILDPATEAVLLGARACLELRYSDALLLRRWRITCARYAADRRQLAEMLDREQLTRRASDLLGKEAGPILTEAIYEAAALKKNRRLRAVVGRYLAPYRTYNAVEASLRVAMRSLHWAAGGLNKFVLHWPRPWSRPAPGGGCLIALIGIDGCGKSTVSANIRAWLSSEIDVMPIYFGTGAGRPSLLLLPFKLAVSALTPLFKVKPSGSSHGTISAQAPGLLYGLLLMVWAAAVAQEKRSKILAARRGANRGLVVVADRYPQNEVSLFNDGPLLSRLAWAPSWLRKWETKAYALAQRLPPDLVIKLIVTPETARRRESDMAPGVIIERIREIPRLTFSAPRVVSIDAEQPLADVIAAVKQEIWRIL
jgi:thymidylate kinase